MTVDLHIDRMLQKREPAVLLLDVSTCVEQVAERFDVLEVNRSGGIGDTYVIA